MSYIAVDAPTPAPIAPIAVADPPVVAPLIVESALVVAAEPPAAAAQGFRLLAPQETAAQGAQLSEGMPPYVVRGISIAGKWRYGVKIKMPGRRQQVRRATRSHPPALHPPRPLAPSRRLPPSAHATHPPFAPLNNAGRCALVPPSPTRTLLRSRRSSFKTQR